MFLAPAVGVQQLQLFDFSREKRNHASLTAASAQVSWVPAPENKGRMVLFNGGTASRGIVTNNASLQITSNLTLAARIYRVATDGGEPRVIDKRDTNDTNAGYAMTVFGTSLGCYAHATGNVLAVSSAAPITTWLTLGFTFQPGATNPGIRAYRDGLEVGSNSTTTVPATNTDTLGILGSTEFDNVDTRMNGYLMWAGVWARTLTAGEMRQLHLRPMAPLALRRRTIVRVPAAVGGSAIPAFMHNYRRRRTG